MGFIEITMNFNVILQTGFTLMQRILLSLDA